jgi:energy-coupling factor transport system permease protein
MSQLFYVDQGSWFSKLHPTGKIFALVFAFGAAIAFNDPRYILALWLVAIVAGVYSNAFQMLFRIKWLFLAICLTSFGLWTLFTRTGDPAFAIAGFAVTRQGLLYGAGMSLRLGLMLFFGLVFIASTPVEDLLFGLLRLKVPFPVAFALSLSFRLVPIFSESIATIRQAQQSRGLKTSGNLVRRFQSYFPLFVPVLLSALRKVDQLSIALESRGFGSPVKRTSWIEFQFGPRDWLVLLISMALCAACVALRAMGLGVVKI